MSASFFKHSVSPTVTHATDHSAVGGSMIVPVCVECMVVNDSSGSPVSKTGHT